MKKKKDKTPKTAEMPEFNFKEFTEEEGRIYDEAVAKFRETVEAGKTLRQAYESYAIDDKELEKLIQADFLKILIAERHFGQRQSLDDIARALDVPASLIRETHARMLQEVGVTAANQFGEQFDGMLPKTND
jgi:transcription initiation factor TFIIIB Brf1 subunit/transcription initiation factor TFIIB